jgi:hypothetical protein
LPSAHEEAGADELEQDDIPVEKEPD